MATYIVLGQFTDQRIRNVADTSKRADAAKELAKKVGAKVRDLFWTIGRYEVALILEAPDDETMTVFGLSAGKLGNVYRNFACFLTSRDRPDSEAGPVALSELGSMTKKKEQVSGRIRVGIGGWSYAPWRGTFYPKGLKQADELTYASSHLTSIEINATHYRLQSAKSFRGWGKSAPDGFMFSVKGPRLVTNQKVLAETGGFIKRFIESGLSELGDKLGPVLWQFAPFKRFDKDDLGKFLDHLPRELDGRKLHHVVEVRHASFCTPEFIELLRDSGVAPVFTETEDFPSIADLSGDVVYARLQRGDDTILTAYPPKALDEWAERARIWAAGSVPADLQVIDATHKPETKPRDVFIYFIHEGKLRAPAAAMALIKRLA